MLLTPEQAENCYTVEDLTKAYRKSKSTIYRWANEYGVEKHQMVPGGALYYDKDSWRIRMRMKR